MASITLDDLKAHLNVTFADDDEMLTRLLDSADKYVGRYFGGDLATAFPDGVDPDIQQAVRLLTASWYESREAVISDERRALVLPFGAQDLIDNHPLRRWSFGA